MLNAIRQLLIANHSEGSYWSCSRHWVLLLCIPVMEMLFGAGVHAQVRVPAARGIVEIEAKQQRRQGDLLIADGDVDVRYLNMRLRADHVEYNMPAKEALARGHVQFDYLSQHLEADSARYNVQSGRGTFVHVRGTIQTARHPNPNILLSPNPLYFEAEEVTRLNESTYQFRGVWLTICLPERPTWKFYSSHATLKLGHRVALINANFRLFRVPLFYLPYASVSVARKVRQSGFLVPEVANTSKKGFQIGDSYYWAPTEWMDTELGAQLLSKRGWSQNADFRARPWDSTRVDYHYFGVVDRLGQGGHQSRFHLDAALPGGWRAVADLNQLSSLIFRLAFATTFDEATASEVHGAAFVANNFRGFSLGFSYLNYKEFLTAKPETAIVLRRAPGVRFSSVEQAPWRRWPVYFGFEVFADAAHRDDPNFTTAALVQRSELAPRVTIPWHWGPWLGVTPTFLVRTTRYGSQMAGGTVVGNAVRRNTAELTVDIRPPSFARFWERPAAKWKHLVEPALVYRYVNGVNDFERFIRFDEKDTLTDTNELEYSLTQRLYRRAGKGQASEIFSWRVAQKYYFDPTFGGALLPGQRNVFQALNSITPFAFADTPRRFSPLVSDLRITPAGRYDLEFHTDYDPVRGKVTALGTLLNIHPYRQSFFNVAHFTVQSDPILQPRENQLRALVGWGQMNRRGWNSAFSINYNVRQRFLQYQVIQASYNGSCCGISFEFRRLALGPVLSDNQFRVALLIANIGTFGTLRRQERVF
jgi:LPS-assembly protein